MKIECSGEVSASPSHAFDAAQVLAEQNVSRARGLAAGDVATRLTRHGLNVMSPPPRRGALVRFMLQFHNVLIYVLLLAGGATAALGHWVDSGVIFGVVLVNAVIGFVQEGKAERALDAIR